MGASHAMPYANNRPGHLSSLDIDKVEEISGMVEPASCSEVSITIASQDLHITYDHFRGNVH